MAGFRVWIGSRAQSIREMSRNGGFIMRPGLRFLKRATRPESRTTCPRQATRGLSVYHRRLHCQPLEERTLLSTTSPQLELFSVSPALFAENRGQWADESLRFIHNGDGANVAMTDAGPVFQVFRRALKEGATAEAENDLRPEGSGDRFDPDQYVTEAATFSASFVGGNTVVPVGLERSDTQFNYFVGPQEDWRSEVPTYEVVASS